MFLLLILLKFKATRSETFGILTLKKHGEPIVVFLAKPGMWSLRWFYEAIQQLLAEVLPKFKISWSEPSINWRWCLSKVSKLATGLPISIFLLRILLRFKTIRAETFRILTSKKHGGLIAVFLAKPWAWNPMDLPNGPLAEVLPNSKSLELNLQLIEDNIHLKFLNWPVFYLFLCFCY